MISSGHLIGFTLASLVIIVIPGPGVLFVVGRALAHGRRTALATAAGHAAGNYAVAACVAVGLGTLLQRSAQVFIAVKLAGALYLVFLGVQAVRHRHSLASAMSSAAGASGGWRALRDGFIVGMTNPKTFILFGAILPQFVNRSEGNVPAQMLLLALISVCIGAGLRQHVGPGRQRGPRLVRPVAAPVRARRRRRRPGDDRRRGHGRAHRAGQVSHGGPGGPPARSVD